VLGVLFSLFTMVTTARIFSYAMLYFQIIVAVFCLYALYSLAKAIINKTEGSILVAVGIFVLIGTVFHDFLVVNEIIYNVHLAPFGLFTFVFIQSFMLSLRFSKAMSSLEVMSDQLKKYNDQMEQLVLERTNRLNESLQEVQSANRKITDSLTYAQRIQNSVLPRSKSVKQVLPESFIIWRPRDIVGGDFYYVDSFEEGMIVAVIDCTGHGVPGALTTMIASAALRRIVNGEGTRNPGEILKSLNFAVKTSLQQDTDQAKSDNGLDASICFIDTINNTLTFAGAIHYLIYIQGNDAKTIKGDRQSIGYKKSDLDFEFTNHTINVEEETSVYLFTDGIFDQLGGEKRYSFGSNRFASLLQENSILPLEQQQKNIEKTFDEYKGKEEALDDVTVIGFRLTNRNN